jgi:uncharacterized protein (DUF1499 family)
VELLGVAGCAEADECLESAEAAHRFQLPDIPFEVGLDNCSRAVRKVFCSVRGTYMAVTE